jgi:hypothetical protein
MARFPMQFSAQDQQGKTIAGATATVSLAGTTTAATVYLASVGGSAITSGVITADSDGFVKYWVDDEDYDTTQYFKVTITGSRFKTTVIDDIIIFPASGSDEAAAAAAASAAEALISEGLCADSEIATAADVVLTGDDVTLTNADVVTTAADVVLTGNDVTSTNADVVSTGNDVTATNADVVSTGQDVATTTQDAIDTAQDSSDTNDDLTATNADVVTTNADVVLTGIDVGLTNDDVVATNADVVLTGIDVGLTGDDLTDTNADVVLTGIDVGLTGDDVTDTNADVVTTNADVVTTTGMVGAVAFAYTFSDTTAMADPGAGIIRFNNGTIGNVTALAFDALSGDASSPDVSDFLASLDDSTNTAHYGYIFVRKVGAPETFVVFDIVGATSDNTGWLEFDVLYNDHNGTISDADDLYISFSRTGNSGSGGEGTSILSTGEATGMKFLRDDSDDSCSWGFNFEKGGDIASATALTLDTDGNAFDVTGTTAITSIDTVGVGAMVLLQFDGIVTVTHDATDLILPDGNDIVTEAGQILIFHEYAAGDWRLVSNSAARRSNDYIKLIDSKATTVAGGTFTQDAWQKRTCTEEIDTGNLVSVSLSVITLEAGTYDCHITAASWGVARHQLRLYNTDDTAVMILGMNAYEASISTTATAQGRFTLAAQKALEIQHYCETTQSGTGFGLPASFGLDEVYLVAEFWKVSQ